jgi:hypothetical protein
MSTRVGTLQAPRAGGSILLAAFLASLVMLTIAVVAISVDRDAGRQGETTFVGRHVVNTPSELSAGIVGGAEQTFVVGTAANTPSELSAQIGGGRPKTVAGGTLANTPTELSGGVRHKYVGDAVGTNTPSELSGGMGNGLPPKIYDRHQRG